MAMTLDELCDYCERHKTQIYVRSQRKADEPEAVVVFWQLPQIEMEAFIEHWHKNKIVPAIQQLQMPHEWFRDQAVGGLFRCAVCNIVHPSRPDFRSDKGCVVIQSRLAKDDETKMGSPKPIEDDEEGWIEE